MNIRPLLTEEQILARVHEMAREVSKDFALSRKEDEPPPIALVLANGALFFAADLLRRINFDVELEVLRISSYAGTRSTGEITVGSIFPTEKIRGHRVIIIDDVFDTGLTLSHIRAKVIESGAVEVRTCALLSKPDRRIVPDSVDYVGFTIPDHFVVGYGLDLNGAWRTLPYIGIISEKEERAV